MQTCMALNLRPSFFLNEGMVGVDCNSVFWIFLINKYFQTCPKAVAKGRVTGHMEIESLGGSSSVSNQTEL